MTVFDYVLKGGTIVDGSGSPRYAADLAVSGNRIAGIGIFGEQDAQKVLDVSGCIVCPGFIDDHAHTDENILIDPSCRNFLGQGITTEVGGNCGEGLAPHGDSLMPTQEQVCRAFGEKVLTYITECTRTYRSAMAEYEKKPMGCNLVVYAAHGMIRNAVMGYDPSAPTDGQLEEMKTLLREAMEEGCAGLSTGLAYSPGSFADREEIVELCRVVREYGGNYTTHMRSESDHILSAMDEAFDVARKSGVTLVLSHHKITGRENWGLSEKTLAKIDEAIAEGLRVYADQYPYTAGASRLVSGLPQEFLAGGVEALLEKLQDRSFRDRVKTAILNNESRGEIICHSAGSPENILVASAPGWEETAGKTIRQIAEAYGYEDPFDALFDIIVRTRAGALAVFFVTSEEDVERIIQHPRIMFGTDSLSAGFFDVMRHPRTFGTFARVLKTYVLEKNLITLEEMVRKATSLPAELLQLENKGLLKTGMDADITVIDLIRLRVGSDYTRPDGPNEGFRYVFVNGQLALEDDVCTGVLAGKLLRHRHA